MKDKRSLYFSGLPVAHLCQLVVLPDPLYNSPVTL